MKYAYDRMDNAWGILGGKELSLPLLFPNNFSDFFSEIRNSLLLP